MWERLANPPGWGPGERRFKSGHPDCAARLRQLAERPGLNPGDLWVRLPRRVQEQITSPKRKRGTNVRPPAWGRHSTIGSVGNGQTTRVQSSGCCGFESRLSH
jgi:hypothetical protein